MSSSSHSRLAAGLPLLTLATLAASQQIGTMIPEVHPKLPTYMCTMADGCVERATTLVTDALSRPFHMVDNPDISCSAPLELMSGAMDMMMPEGAAANASAMCSDPAGCAASCALEGIEYEAIGVLTSGSALTLRQYLPDESADGGYKKVSPRVYLLAEDEANYEMMRLVNRELTYDVDLSQLVCGMNGALYLSEMDESGSRSDDANPAGAAYGTGYCDAQCFDVPWINGLANLDASGACCNEMDIWEANARATVFTPHTCSGTGSFLCSGDECGPGAAGVCDKSGCGLNPFRSGFPDYYGTGGNMTVDTSQPFTVVTQFVSSDGTDDGDLTEIRRLYIQGGTIIENHPESADAGSSDEPSFVADDFCSNFADDYMRLGATKGMGESLKRGMVLIFSIWNSDGDFMNWLDSGEAGPCGETEGDPADILMQNPDISVTFSNIRWGEIGSTFDMDGPEPAAIPGIVRANQQGDATRSTASTLAAVMVGAVALMLP